MIDKKFAKTEFSKFAVGSDESAKLHRELEQVLAEELNKVVRTKFQELAEQLCQLGHEISEDTPEYDEEYSSWNYEHLDISDENSPRIWLHTQVGVMSGYKSED